MFGFDEREGAPRRGRPLPPRARARAERTLGADLSDVRVHEGARDLGSPRALAATYGRDIGFAPGAYHPGQLTTEAILAHELVHVVQQRAPSRAPLDTRTAESEADAAAAVMLTGEAASPRVSPGGLQLSRCDPTDAPRAGGRGVHYDDTIGSLSRPSRENWESTFGQELTQYFDPDAANLRQHLTTMDQGGVYVFFGHGGQSAPGTTVGIMANDGVVRGREIQDALAADGSPPTMVVLGGCATGDILHFVSDGGVPIAAGITENVSNLAGAAAIGVFIDELAGGATFAEARSAANQRMGSGLLNMSLAQLQVRYARGYSSSMTLEEARAKHLSR